MTLHPQGIKGLWKSGLVLDWHTIDSVCVGENEFGFPIFETTRSEIGELLYQFKYHNNQEALKLLLETACRYLDKAKGKFDVVIPIPPSKPSRTVTAQIAKGLAKCLNAQYCGDILQKRASTEELKSVREPERREELLSKAFSISSSNISDQVVLLVDDLFRSGATLEAATKVVKKQGKAAAVYVFAVTRTRVNR